MHQNILHKKSYLELLLSVSITSAMLISHLANALQKPTKMRLADMKSCMLLFYNMQAIHI